jgi:hypothetical protein
MSFASGVHSATASDDGVVSGSPFCFEGEISRCLLGDSGDPDL